MDDLDKLKSITDKSLMISMIKLLVFKDLNEKVKNIIEKKPNDFYTPSEKDFQTEDNFKSFINILTDKILKEIR